MQLWFVLSLLWFIFLGQGAQADQTFADCKLDRSNLDRSIAACTKLLATTGMDPRRRAYALHNRGSAYWRKNDLGKALQDFDASLKLDSHWAFRFQDRGEIYYQMHQYDKAIADYNTAIRLDGSRAFRFHARASALRELGRLDEALADFTRAIELDHDHDFRFLDRGNLYLSRSEYAKAIADFTRAFSLNPRFAAALYQRCAAKLRWSGAKDALSDCDQAIQIEPSDAGAYKIREAVKEALGDLRGALADLNSWQALNPLDIELASRRKRLETLLNDPQVPSNPPTPPQISTAVPGSVSSSLSDKRVALVIGNAAYPGPALLRNPANDADDVAAALKKIGFEGVEGKDLTLAGFSETLAKFNHAADRADVALFYYSGHGMQLDERNWLLPIDARTTSVFDVRRYNVPLQDIVSELEARSRTTLVFLDACRNNPLEDELKSRLRAQGRGSDEGRGLGRFDIKSPQTLVVFATRANRTAADGVGRNSPFTSAFLQHVFTPAVEIEVLMKRVSAAVSAQTNGHQQPERLSRLEQEFYFVPAK